MAGAEELGAIIDPVVNSIHGHYNLGLSYEEYAKSYSALGQTQKALDYVKLTQKTLPKTLNNKVLLIATVVYSGTGFAQKVCSTTASRSHLSKGLV